MTRAGRPVSPVPGCLPTRGIVALALVLAGLPGCARPPEYPADADHLSATEPRTCFDCHHRPTSPPMHRSHFEEDGTLKTTRQVCHNCHRPVGFEERYDAE